MGSVKVGRAYYPLGSRMAVKHPVLEYFDCSLVVTVTKLAKDEVEFEPSGDELEPDDVAAAAASILRVHLTELLRQQGYAVTVDDVGVVSADLL